jgi:hypothetical protein
MDRNSPLFRRDEHEQDSQDENLARKKGILAGDLPSHAPLQIGKHRKLRRRSEKRGF